MEKRLPLALLLSLVVLVAWSYVAGPSKRERELQEQEAAQVEAAAAEGLSATDPTPARAPGTTAPEPTVPTGPVVGSLAGDTEERELVLEVGTPGEQGSYHAVFSNRGASLLDLSLGNYFDRVGLDDAEQADREHWSDVVESVATFDGITGSLRLRTSASSHHLERTPLDSALWSMKEIDRGVEFELAQGTGVRFVKRVTFEPSSYRMHVALELHNESPGGEIAPGRAAFVLTPAEVVAPESDDGFYVEPQAVAAGRTRNDFNDNTSMPDHDSVEREIKGKKTIGDFDIPTEVVSFAGVHNKYFAALMRAGPDPKSQASIKGATWRRIYDQAYADENPAKAGEAWRFIATDVLLELGIPAAGESTRYEYIVYAGPKLRSAILADNPDHEALLREDLEAFLPGVETAAAVLVSVLHFFHGLVGNWGIAIILMTLSVRLLLFPLNRRSQTTMARYQKQMKRVQPKIDELKKKYENDPDKQRKAQAELMQKEGLMPPLGGCLPIFVQMPIFFGLFQALRTSFELRQAPFFSWITDLSKPDRLLRLDLETGLPIIGTVEYLNILPPLMVVLWIAQQMVMPKPADEQAQRMQKMMMFMPLVMGVFLYNYAAGLSVYMITQSFLGIFEIGVIKRVWPIDDIAPEKKKKPGFLARLAEKQAEQVKRAQGMQKNPGSPTRAQSAKSRKRKKSRKQ